MKKAINKKYAQKILKRSLKSLGLSENMKTDPLMMKDITREMRLDDFKSRIPCLNGIFSDMLSTPASLEPIVKDIVSGIIDKHPAIVEFLDLALDKGWLNRSEHVLRSVHVIYILEFLTSGMCNNPVFFNEVHKHITDKEKMYGIDSKHTVKTFLRYLTLTDDYFEIIKTMSIDPVMIIFRPDFINFNLEQEKLKELLKKKKIYYLEYKILNHHNGILGLDDLLKINIYEAGISEYMRGFKSNSISAFLLSELVDAKGVMPRIRSRNQFPERTKNPMYDRLANGDNKIIEMPFDQGWVSLYESWNLAFMLSEIQNLDLLLPKLLIPSVINAEPVNYLQARVVSLWISINNVIIRKCSDKPEVTGPSHKEEMARAFGRINKKYALELAKTELDEDSVILRNHYRRFFSHPFWNFFRLVSRFLR